MRMARIARILELVADCMPGVYEWTLLVPAFFGLWSAARALGLDVDLGPETVAVISVTFSYFVWIILNSLTYRGPKLLGETTNEALGHRHSLSPSYGLRAIKSNSGAEFRSESDSIHVKRSHGESAHQEKHYPAGLP